MCWLSLHLQAIIHKQMLLKIKIHSRETWLTTKRLESKLVLTRCRCTHCVPQIFWAFVNSWSIASSSFCFIDFFRFISSKEFFSSKVHLNSLACDVIFSFSSQQFKLSNCPDSFQYISKLLLFNIFVSAENGGSNKKIAAK